MKTLKIILVLVCSFILATGPALATLTATVTPGYTFSAGEVPSISTLNLLAQPTVLISGSVDGSTGLTAGSVAGNLLADSVVDGTTTAYNGSSPRAIYVLTPGLVNNLGGIISSNSVLRLRADTNYFTLSSNSITGGPGSGYGTNMLTLVAQSLKDTNISPTAGIALTKLNWVNTNFSGAKRLLLVETNDLASGVNLGSQFYITNQTGTNLTVMLTQFESAEYTIGSLPVNVAHVWTNTPTQCRWVLRCVTANAGYAIGDELEAYAGARFAGGANSTNVFLSYDGNTINLPNKNTGASTAITAGSWRVKCYARP